MSVDRVSTVGCLDRVTGCLYKTFIDYIPRVTDRQTDRQTVTLCVCVQSNSWSTPQSSLSCSLSTTQRHSDLCPPRQPLSPLYDEPCTPDLQGAPGARAPGPRTHATVSGSRHPTRHWLRLQCHVCVCVCVCDD